MSLGMTVVVIGLLGWLPVLMDGQLNRWIEEHMSHLLAYSVRQKTAIWDKSRGPMVL